MENIYEIMAKAGVEIPDDKKAEIDKAVLSNYKQKDGLFYLLILKGLCCLMIALPVVWEQMPKGA
ncbi:MAG: hypothetical protein RR992_04845 [Clostridiales bacterium]